MSQHATVRQRGSARARELRGALLALRREQRLLVTELVWNEMRAREIHEQLTRQAPSPAERQTLERDLHRRLELVRSLARWEQAADRSYGRQWEILAKLHANEPGLAAALPDIDEVLAQQSLKAIARAAARELGLALDGGVDGC